MLRRNPLFQKSAWTTGAVVIAISLFSAFSDYESDSNAPSVAEESTTDRNPSAESAQNGDQLVARWREFVSRNPPPDREASEPSDSTSSTDSPSYAGPPPPTPPQLESLADKAPEQWGEVVSGVYTRLDTDEPQVALTLDACGGDYDRELIDLLERHQVPATLFVSGFWLSRHGGTLEELAAHPLFEIANHGLRHLPCSVSGKSALDIEGTRSVGEAHREIAENARRLEAVTGERPRFYRSGTAHYDEICTAIADQTDHQVVGFDIVGDYGAMYTADQVDQALREVSAGSIVVLHMNRPQSETAEGVARAIPDLLEEGFEFVHLSDHSLR